MADLPENWAPATVGELCNLTNGRAFSPSDWSSHGLPIVRIQNLRDPDAPYNYFAGEVLDKHKISNGDLLFAWSGTPGTSFGSHIWKGGVAVLNQHIFRVDFDEVLLHPRYLQLVLNARLPVLIGQAKGGAGLKHLTKGTVEAIPVPLPPRQEQNRIAALLEETTDRLIHVSDELTAQMGLATSLSASLISDAVALTPDRSSWSKARVGDIGEVKLGRQRSPEHHAGPNMRPYLRVANVMEARIDISDVMSMNFTDREFEIYQLRAGDILLNEGQSIDLVGRAAIYRGEIPSCCYTNTLVRFRAGPFILPEFALLVFRHYLRAGEFRRIAKITTNLAHLGATRFAQLEMAFPSLPEQRAIVERCHALLGAAAALYAKFDILSTYEWSIRRNIESMALSGSLTHQRPEAEPKPVPRRPGIIKGASPAKNVVLRVDGASQAVSPTMRRSVSKIISIETALRHATSALETKALFFAVGYSEDASVSEVEQFYVTLRRALQQNVIYRTGQRKDLFQLVEKDSRE